MTEQEIEELRKEDPNAYFRLVIEATIKHRKTSSVDFMEWFILNKNIFLGFTDEEIFYTYQKKDGFDNWNYYNLVYAEPYVLKFKKYCEEKNQYTNLEELYDKMIEENAKKPDK